VIHVVVCWLKTPGDTNGRRVLLAAADSLRAIPGVQTVTAGTVLPSDRTVVDSSWDVAYVMTFADWRALAEYVNNPAHLRLRQQVLDPNTRYVRVYDIVTGQ
jgi:hypothetical protein